MREEVFLGAVKERGGGEKWSKDRVIIKISRRMTRDGGEEGGNSVVKTGRGEIKKAKNLSHSKPPFRFDRTTEHRRSRSKRIAMYVNNAILVCVLYDNGASKWLRNELVDTVFSTKEHFRCVDLNK